MTKNTKRISVLLLPMLVLLLSASGCVNRRAGNETEETEYQFGSSNILGTLGKYTPDNPPVQFPDDDYLAVHRENMKELESISKEDLDLVSELREDYQSLTVYEMRERFYQLSEKSNSFAESVSYLSYAGMHDEFIEMDDFYSTLFFVLQDYYYEYGPENVRDRISTFVYYRYFGEKQEEYTSLNFDYEKVVIMSYDIELDYIDMDVLTIGARNQIMADMIKEINKCIDNMTYEEWKANDARQKFEELISDVLKQHSTDNIVFSLYQVSYDPVKEF